jgi:hypothetical protein
MSVVAYVSGHGLGHSAREVEILRRLPETIPLHIVTKSPSWFWQEEMTRPFVLREAAFDVGCLQTTSLEVDQAATLAAFKAQQVHNQENKQAELTWLKEVGARVIITDVAAFPLMLAKQRGIPGICVANFTWADIYAEYVREHTGFHEIVRDLEREYAQATCLLETGLSLPMPYFLHRESVGLVARRGKNRRRALPHAEKRLALIYTGNWGLPFPWERLERFTDWHFVTLTPPPIALKNLTVLPRTTMPHPDIVASVDLVISKLGYGILGECLANATPILYPPRAYFVEFAAMERSIVDWPGRMALSLEAFLGLEWSEALAHAPKHGEITALPADGGAVVAAKIEELYA